MVAYHEFNLKVIACGSAIKFDRWEGDEMEIKIVQLHDHAQLVWVMHITMQDYHCEKQDWSITVS